MTVSCLACASRCSRERSAPSVERIAQKGRRSTTRSCPSTARPGCRACAAARSAGSPGRRSARSRSRPTRSRRWRRSGGRSPRSASRRGRRRLRRHAAVLVHQPDAVVVGRAPHAGVGRDGTPSSRATSKAAFSGNSGSPVTSKAIWKPSMSSCVRSGARRRSGSPRTPTTPTGPAGGCRRRARSGRDRLERVDGGLGVVDRLQPVRPVDRGGHARLERLQRRQQVARVDVLRAEDPPLEVVEDEVLRERPVGAVAAHRRLPHVAVRVDHARHDDAVGGVDLGRFLGRLEPRPDAAISSPVTSTSASSRTSCASFMSARCRRSTTGRPASISTNWALSLGLPGTPSRRPVARSRNEHELRPALARRWRSHASATFESGTASTATRCRPAATWCVRSRKPSRRTSGGGMVDAEPRRSSDTERSAGAGSVISARRCGRPGRGGRSGRRPGWRPPRARPTACRS